MTEGDYYFTDIQKLHSYFMLCFITQIFNLLLTIPSHTKYAFTRLCTIDSIASKTIRYTGPSFYKNICANDQRWLQLVYCFV